MAMEVDLALNARRFQAGTKDAEKALADLQDVVEDFTRDASKAGEEAADGFDNARDAARDAEREVDDLGDAAKDAEREFKDAADAARDMGKDAERAGRDAEGGMRDAGEAVGTFRDEAKQNAEEVASSFDGSVESIADGFQGLAATAFAGFGPAGVVAGVAAAAGIGLAIAGFENVAEAEEESRELAAGWAQTWIDNGSRVLSAATLTTTMNEIISDTERWAEVETAAAAAGVDQSVALRALAGDSQAYAQVMGELTAAEEANNAAIAAAGDEMTARALGLYEERDAIGESIRALESNSEAMTQGQVIADAYARSVLDVYQASGEASASVNELGDTVYALPDGATVTIDAETGQATLDLDGVEEQANNLDGSTATVTVQVDDRAVRNYRPPPLPTATIPVQIARPGMPVPT